MVNMCKRLEVGTIAYYINDQYSKSVPPSIGVGEIIPNIFSSPPVRPDNNCYCLRPSGTERGFEILRQYKEVYATKQEAFWKFGELAEEWMNKKLGEIAVLREQFLQTASELV